MGKQCVYTTLRLLFVVVLSFYAAILRADEVTYTITSRTAVETTGDAPQGSTVSYQQSGTGQKGQMTAGNNTELILKGFDGLQLTRISLQMHSNKQAGGGSLEMSIGEEIMWSIPVSDFADDSWNGEFTNEWVAVTHDFAAARPTVGKGEEIRIAIDALENSLYVQSYTITYGSAPTKPYTVGFLTGTDDSLPALTESAPGAGIQLPAYNYTDGTWSFMGWTCNVQPSTTTKPDYYLANTTYYPSSDEVLYALYCDLPEGNQEFVQDTLLESGTYVLCCPFGNVFATGEVGARKSGKVSVMSFTEEMTKNNADLYYYPLDNLYEETFYYIEFYSDSTLVIYHELTNTAIGYPLSDGSTLNKQEKRWNYSVLPDKTLLIYHDYGTRKRYFAYDPSADAFTCSTLVYKEKANCLFLTDNMPAEKREAQYVTFITEDDLPSYMDDSVQINEDTVTNPQHQQIQVFTLDGRLLLKTDDNLPLNQLQHGAIYLLQIGDEKRKISIP